MNLSKIRNLLWEGRTKESKLFLIRIREPKDKEKFDEFIKLMPLEASYPKNILLSESDLKPGEFKLTTNHFLIEMENKIIGALSFHPGNEHDYHFRHGVRIHLNILPPFKNQGFGSALLDTFEDFAKEELFYRISTGTIASNISAIKLFLKKGYKIEGRTTRAMKLRFKGDKEEIKGVSEVFVDAILLGKWIGPKIIDYKEQIEFNLR